MHTRLTSPRLAGGIQAGFTLLEIMIALTIALVLLTVLSLVFVANGSYRQDLDRSSRLVENSSYSLQRLTDDLRLAGYYAEFDINSAGLPAPATMVVADSYACATDLPSLRAALTMSIQGYDGGTGLPAACTAVLTDRKTGSDVLVIRRVDTCAVGAAGCDAVVANVPYFQASQCTSDGTYVAPATNLPTIQFKLDTNTANLDLRLIDCNVNGALPLAAFHRFVVDIYYVANNDNAGDGIPTLKLAQLGATGGATAFSVIPLAEGIENLQLEYGLDTTAAPGDGIPDVYTADPSTYNGCAGAACVTNWINTVAVKVSMLGRNTERTAIGYVNDKSFTLGLQANGTANTFGPFNDRFKRHVYAASVRLYNPGGRRE